MLRIANVSFTSIWVDMQFLRSKNCIIESQMNLMCIPIIGCILDEFMSSLHKS